MRYYIPPKTDETDDEFWARMAKMAEGVREDEAPPRTQNPGAPLPVRCPCPASASGNPLPQ